VRKDAEEQGRRGSGRGGEERGGCRGRAKAVGNERRENGGGWGQGVRGMRGGVRETGRRGGGGGGRSMRGCEVKDGAEGDEEELGWEGGEEIRKTGRGLEEERKGVENRGYELSGGKETRIERGES